MEAERSILWLSNETPDRSGQGGQRRQYFQIEALARLGHRIHVVSLAGHQDDRSIRAIATVERHRPRIRGILVPYWSGRVTRLLRSGRFDRAVVSHVESWPLYESGGIASGVPVLVDVHNVFSSWYRSIDHEEDAAFHERLEARAIAGATVVSVCSDQERARLVAAHPEVADRTIVAPLGIALAEWPERQWDRREPVVALFGSWSWKPNADGLAWFLAEVWPKVMRLDPAARARIAGTGVDPARLPDGAETIGRVPDLSAFLAAASVVAVPVRNGVGAAMKYGEALASGAPVIATSDAASAHPSAPAFVDDDPDAWAHWIVARLAARRAEPVPDPARAYALRELGWAHTVAPIGDWLAAPVRGR